MTLKTLYTLFKSHPEGAWIMQEYNAALLYELVLKHPVKRVLDLGTGIGVSAAVCALAFKDKGETDYQIDSLEQFDKCIKIAQELIPKELQAHLTIHKSSPKIWSYEGIPYQCFSNYEIVPGGDYDLIINDGPSFWRENDSLIDLPNGTVTELLLAGRLKPGTLVAWDGRFSMLQILERYFGSEDPRESAFELYRANQRGDDFNVLRRLSNPLVCRDQRLAGILKTTTFFNEEKITSPVDLTAPPLTDETSLSGTANTF